MLGMCWAKDFPTFFGLMLVRALLYVPTISVSNSIAFAHMECQKEFGLVRMGGTIGWILVAWPLYFILEGKSGARAMSASRTIFPDRRRPVARAGCLQPASAPYPAEARTGRRRGFAWMKAAKYLAKPYLAVLFLVTLPSMP